MAAERLQKVMAAAGLCSRRRAEELLRAGLVKVNGAQPSWAIGPIQAATTSRWTANTLPNARSPWSYC